MANCFLALFGFTGHHASLTYNTILNRSVNQSELLKDFPLPLIAGPQNCGQGATAPIAPPPP